MMTRRLIATAALLAAAGLGAPAHAENSPTVQKGREEVYQFSINWLFYALTH